MAEDSDFNQFMDDDSEKGGLISLKSLLIAVGVMVISAAGGVVIGNVVSGPRQAAADEQIERALEEDVPDPDEESEELEYLAMSSVAVHLNTARATRYIQLTLVLGVDEKDKVKVAKALEKSKLNDKTIGYLASCSLEDVRGERNINKIKRELKRELNSVFSSDGKETIKRVLLKDFAVK